MNANERRAIGRLFESLTRLTDPDASMREFMESIMALDEAPIGHLCRVPETMATGKFVEAWYGDFTGEIQKTHNIYVWGHPIWPYVKKLEQNAYSQPEVVGRTEFFNTEYGTDFAAKRGVTETHAVSLKDSDGTILWGLGLMHHGARRRSQKRKLKIIDELAPHLGRGLANIEALRRFTVQLGEVSSAMQAWPEPCAVITRGQLAFASAPMVRLLNIHRKPPSRNLAFRELIAACKRAKITAPPPVFRAEDGRAFNLRVMQTSRTADSWLIHLTPRNAVSLAADRVFAIQAGLSPREADVFALLASGKANKEIGRELGIAFDTVRALIRRIFTKVQASGRIEAINAVRRIGAGQEHLAR